MKLSEEMKNKMSEYDCLQDIGRSIPTAIYGIDEFMPKVEQLEKKLEQLKQQVKKMKCCGNCRNIRWTEAYTYCSIKKLNGNKKYYVACNESCDKWELAE